MFTALHRSVVFIDVGPDHLIDVLEPLVPRFDAIGFGASTEAVEDRDLLPSALLLTASLLVLSRLFDPQLEVIRDMPLEFVRLPEFFVVRYNFVDAVEPDSF